MTNVEFHFDVSPIIVKETQPPDTRDLAETLQGHRRVMEEYADEVI